MKELALDQTHQHARALEEQAAAPAMPRRSARPAARGDIGNGGDKDAGARVDGCFSEAINAGLVARAANGPSQALPAELRQMFEGSLGVGLHDVRIHTHAAAADAAAAFEARAFAHGNDIFFASGAYQPGTPEGDHLIAHEVAHTVQQRGSAPTTQHKLEVSGTADVAEHAADTAASAMLRGAPASAGTAGASIARTPQATSPGNSVAAGAAQTIAQRFPRGITVAVTKVAENVQDRAARILGRGRTIRQEVPDSMLPELPGGRRSSEAVKAARRLAVHPITPDEARDLADALCANDAEFARRAADFVSIRQVVGGDPAQPRIGAPITFVGQHEDPVAKVRTLSHTVGRLPGATTDGNIRELAIFTHGGHHGLDLSASSGGAAALRSQLGPTFTHDVNVELFACNAGGADAQGASMAQVLAEGLAQDGHDATVFGHADYGNATDNARGRTFKAAGGAQGPATELSNYGLVFDAPFIQREIHRIGDNIQPAATRADVQRVFDHASTSWLAHALLRTGPQGITYAFQIGFAPQGAIDACRGLWANEGENVIRAALHLHPGATAPAPVQTAVAPARAQTDAATARSEPPPAAHVQENRVVAAPSEKPAQDLAAKTTAPARPAPAAMPTAARAAPAPTAAPTAVSAVAATEAISAVHEGTLAVVQRPGPLRPRHPGDGMVIHDAPGGLGTVEQIVPGTFVHVVRIENGHALVRHRDREGWVNANTLHDVDLSQEDVQREAMYHLASAESGNDAAEYSPDSNRVNIGIASWTGRRIHSLLVHYQDAATARNQLGALYEQFGGEPAWNDIVRRFVNPDMSDHDSAHHPRAWVGPTLSATEQEQFRTAEAALPFLRDVDVAQEQSDIAHYMRLLATSAYPFIAADGTISEVALNVVISAAHQKGDGGLIRAIHHANLAFGVDTAASQPAALVRDHVDEIGYLRQLTAGISTHGRYTGIISEYADSPRRYTVRTQEPAPAAPTR